MLIKQHWEKVYATKGEREVGWFQEVPETSLGLIRKYALQKHAPILDVGGGNAHLTNMLFIEGYTNLTVLDISANAIEISKQRLGRHAGEVNWHCINILEFHPEKAFQIWHDRAVFHFLTLREEVNDYAAIAAKHIVKGGHLILATFSVNGPKTCSGLPISQYSEEKLHRVFGKSFNLKVCFEEVHITPSGNPQIFIWAVFKRK